MNTFIRTTNETTTAIGQCTATMIRGTRLLPTHLPMIRTWELVYPRYIHSELMTHRVFSRNASSSRATPTSVLIDEVRKNPVFFDSVGANKRGMQAGEEVSDEIRDEFKKEWAQLGRFVAMYVEMWNKKYGIHKQVANRALEPWLPIRTLVTATDLGNFYSLRLAPDAQPEMQSLAMAMKLSERETDWHTMSVHIPYMEYFEGTRAEQAVRSVAACARVSVLRNNGRETTYEEDLEFVEGLWKNGHLSPFEHLAVRQTDGEVLRCNLNEPWVNIRTLMEWRDIARVGSVREHFELFFGTK